MKLLVTGATGLLGSEFVRAGLRRGWSVSAPGRAEMDVMDSAVCARVVAAESPDWVVHCAGFTQVDRAESEPEESMRSNRDGSGNVARAAFVAGAGIAHISTDYVFDGSKGAPYAPNDPVSPIGAYAQSKVAAEEAVRAVMEGRVATSPVPGLGAPSHVHPPRDHPPHLIVRTGWLYGEGRRDFVDLVLERAGKGDELRIVDDQRGRPTWTRNATETVLDLIEHDARGTVHVNDRGETTWYGFARAILEEAGVEASVRPVSSRDFGAPARRPLYSVLDLSETEAELGRVMTPWRQSLRTYLGERSRREPTE